jgi:2-amino-4-hydroxy-6-hydroxymethyldihydropteridine diphosphokinase
VDAEAKRILYNAVMATALIGLGSNLGDRAATLDKAIELLRSESQIRVIAVSSFRPSKPAGGPAGQGEFINACSRLETSLAPEELLTRLLAVEAQVGRVREERWGPRVIDLDLLLYDRVEMKSPTLELPHPRMCYRRFVLEPAAEIAGEMVWPVNGWSVGKLLEYLTQSKPYIALHGTDSSTGPLLKGISKATCCRTIERRDEVEFSDSDQAAPWLSSCKLLTASSMKSLKWHAAVIAKDNWPTTDHWTLSDFWFFAFQIECDGIPTDLVPKEKYVALWQTLVERTVKPRLVVTLQDDIRLHSRGDEPQRRDHATRLIRERNENAERLSRDSRVGPVLKLSAVNPSLCLREVLAAMQAME